MTAKRVAAATMTLCAVALGGVARAADEAGAPGPAASATIRIAVGATSPPLLLDLFAGDDGVFAQVRDARSGRLLQSLSAEDADPARSVFAWLEDLNFDDHLDVALPTWTGATGNVGHAVWLWSPTAGRFERNALLSGASQLATDSGRRELTSHWNAGHAGALYTHETIRCPDGVPTLVRREKVDWDGRQYVKAVEELRDGKLALVARTTSPDPPPPREER